MKQELIEIVGWAGFLMILLGYILLSTAILDSKSLIYFSLNGVGSAGIIFVSFNKKNYQPAVLNIIFLFASVYAIIRLLI